MGQSSLRECSLQGDDDHASQWYEGSSSSWDVGMEFGNPRRPRLTVVAAMLAQVVVYDNDHINAIFHDHSPRLAGL